MMMFILTDGLPQTIESRDPDALIDDLGIRFAGYIEPHADEVYGHLFKMPDVAALIAALDTGANER